MLYYKISLLFPGFVSNFPTVIHVFNFTKMRWKKTLQILALRFKYKFEQFRCWLVPRISISHDNISRCLSRFFVPGRWFHFHVFLIIGLSRHLLWYAMALLSPNESMIKTLTATPANISENKIIYHFPAV